MGEKIAIVGKLYLYLAIIFCMIIQYQEILIFIIVFTIVFFIKIKSQGCDMFDRSSKIMTVNKIVSLSWSGSFWSLHQNSGGIFGHLYLAHNSFWTGMRIFSSCWSRDCIEKENNFFEIKSRAKRSISKEDTK